MPLKHRSETALLLLLGLAMCVTGFLLALLPLASNMLGFFAILLTLVTVYPIALTELFQRNRADYEFRLLHWFPFAAVVLWAILTFFSPMFTLARILSLGFFYLWSLPLVVLGIAFLVIFSLHVIRRSTVRITALAVLLVAFTAAAIAAESTGINPGLARAVFPKPATIASIGRRGYASLSSLLTFREKDVTMPIGDEQLTGTSGTPSSYSAFVTEEDLIASSTAHSLPPVAGDKKPNGLPRSGPESFVVLLLAVLALYTTTLHRRAQTRV